MNAASPQTVHVPSRDIPVPEGISAELRQKIITTPPLPGFQQADLPTSNAGWEKWWESMGVNEARLESLLKRFDVSLQERLIAGVKCFLLTPCGVPKSNRDRLLMSIHGGGFVVGGGRVGTDEAILAAGLTKIPVVAVDYRMPPEFPFPAAVDDAIAVWTDLAKEHAPANMGILGTSAGGNLVLASVQRMIRERLALPAAVCANTPWADLSRTGDSYYINEGVDPMTYDLLKPMAESYAGGIDLKDPRLSPVYGEFRGFPPTLLISGTRDLFLSNTVRVNQKLRSLGVQTQLHVLEGQAHGDSVNPLLPETEVLFAELAAFFGDYLDS